MCKDLLGIFCLLLLQLLGCGALSLLEVGPFCAWSQQGDILKHEKKGEKWKNTTLERAESLGSGSYGGQGGKPACIFLLRNQKLTL